MKSQTAVSKNYYLLPLLLGVIKNNFRTFVTILVAGVISTLLLCTLTPQSYKAKGLVNIGYVNLEVHGISKLEEVPIEILSDLVVRLKSQFETDTNSKKSLPIVQQVSQAKSSNSIIQIITLGSTSEDAIKKLNESIEFIVNEHKSWTDTLKMNLEQKIKARKSFANTNSLKSFELLENSIQNLDIERNLGFFRIRPTRQIGKITVSGSAIKENTFLILIFSIIFFSFVSYFFCGLIEYSHISKSTSLE